MKNKKTWIMVIPILISLIVITSLLLINNSNLKMRISGIKVDENEYEMIINNKRYDVTQYFIDKYGAKITESFWTESFNGEYPYKMLADETTKELVRIHSIYNVAKEKGYVDSEEYKDFIKRLNDENNLRAQNIKEGKPVYGLSNFAEEVYLEYEADKLQKAYCNDLNNEGMEISLEEATKYYEENKKTLFIKNDDFKLAYVKVYYESLDLSNEEVKNIKNYMIEISKKVDEDSFLLELLENDEKLKDYLSYEEVLSAELSAKAKVMGDVLDISMQLEKGEITQVLDENGCLYLIQCIDRVNYDYLPFEEVRDNINKALREKHYDEIIISRSENLVVDGEIDNIYKFTKNILK